MAVGKIETTVETGKEWKRRSGLRNGGSSKSGGKNRGGGGGNNGGGGGGDKPENQSFQEIERYEPNKSKVFTWFLLIVVLMTFSVLIAAYIVIATNKALEWRPFEGLPIQVWISTFLILGSSFTLYIAQRAIYKNDQPQAKKWLLATTALGAAFISSQLLAWLELVQRGVYVSSNQYAGFFYVLTIAHAVHVLGGIIALGSIVLRTWQPDNSFDGVERRKTLAQVVGWYWHFIGGLWLILLFLLAFWK